MKKVAIMSDSNCGITQSEAKEMGIFVLPMPLYINEEMFYEDITLTQEQFYERLAQDVDVKTSQPTPGEVTDMWDKILTEYDEIVHIPMSSGLSGSCETAMMLAEDDDYKDKVFVVDNQRISITMIHSIYDAMALAKAGKSGKEIKDILTAEKMESSIYITLETLKYLKKGGRITPAAAAIGTVLNLKPVLQIQGEKLDAFSKTRGIKAAKKVMLDAIKKDLDTRFAKHVDTCGMYMAIAYTADKEKAMEWKAEVEAAFPGYELIMYPLSLSVACHIGPGAVAVAVSKKVSLD